MWLDDVRAAPEGWTWVRTVSTAKQLLLTGCVQWASLDHDLGTCSNCYALGDQDVDERVCSRDCLHECHETGSDLVRWMAETNTWPGTKPRVHSANPVGARYMRDVIDRYWCTR